ncbi:MAG: flagellin [Pseudomonadota bacterium]
MSSILTNNSAMVALETLRGINKDLAMVQSEISTGKKVSNAKDNAAIWAISTVMSTDVESFKQIQDSLNLGNSSVGVARSASEQVTSVLQDMKELIVSAQEENVDRTKIQTDIAALRDQVGSIVGAAQFNGLNLIDGSSTDDVAVLASLDRSSAGTVSASYIDVARADLSVSNTSSAATYNTAGNTADQSLIANGAANAGAAATVASGAPAQDIQIVTVGDGTGYQIILDDTGGDNSIGQRTFEYVANADDSAASVAATLATQVQNFLSATGESGYTVARSGDTLSITNNSGGAVDITANAAAGGTAGVTAGGLGDLATIDVTTDAGATSALTAIEGLLDQSIDAAAAFGSAQKRIETQSEFVQTMVDSLTTGIGGLTDTDMEAASAKLQALQVQQQLGTQALSIANQAPQSLLSLFR